MNEPLITIITVSYNAEEFIEKSILSVLNQNYKNIQYIIIDGASKDNTPNIIRKYIKNINLYISETDSGIYDAINKGLRNAKGDLIKILNSDDTLPENSLRNVHEFYKKNNLKGTNSLIIGNTHVINRDNFISKTIKNNTYSMIGFQTFNHPGWYITIEATKNLGFYNTKFKISSDFEYFLRLKTLKFRILYLDKAVACYRKGGRSSLDLNGPLEVIKIHFKYKFYFLGIIVFIQHFILRCMQIIYRFYRKYFLSINR